MIFAQSYPAVELQAVTDSVWVHTTYKTYGQYKVPSNGLIVQTAEGLILIDTPWDDSLTTKLLAVARERFDQNIAFAVVTHAHDDRMGGIHVLHENGIKVVGYSLVCQRAEALGYEKPEQILSADTVFSIGNKNFELFYPGAGHTIDNTVVWLLDQKILFGGCLVKAESAADLGNVREAYLEEWPRSINRLIEKFPDGRIIVPGHGQWGGLKLLNHTMNLLSKQ